MKKFSLRKAEGPLPDLRGLQLSMNDDAESRLARIQQYRIDQVLSDTPPESTIEDYPYRTVEGGVIPHKAFSPLFKNGKSPLLTKEKADELFSSILGYDKKSGFPVRIYQNGNDIAIQAYSPTGEIYFMECSTGQLESSK